MSYCVEFDRVSKCFVPDSPVLDDVSLNLPEGVTTAVVGESGSGKTTLLQLVNAVLRPDQGEVRVFGSPIPDDLVSHRRSIGYSVQGAGLFPHMTNADNVQLLAHLEGWSDEQMRSRFAQLVEQMELDASIGTRYPQELSGGQQQRIGLCRALMLRPKMLLLDEPFSAVDPITRVGIYERFEEVQRRESVSTLLVTHDMREAVKLASHLVIVRGGRIEQAGPIEEVCAQPDTDYVANLLAQQL